MRPRWHEVWQRHRRLRMSGFAQLSGDRLLLRLAELAHSVTTVAAEVGRALVIVQGRMAAVAAVLE